MKMLVKTRPSLEQSPEDVVLTAVRTAASERLQERAEVTRLFPGQVGGNRARMVSIAFPDDTSSSEVAHLTSTLRKDPHLEYVEEPARKQLLAGVSRRP